jgi:hypothetical protein
MALAGSVMDDLTVFLTTKFVYVHANMSQSQNLLLKLWGKLRIRLPRRKPRKHLRQLELNLWPKRR